MDEKREFLIKEAKMQTEALLRLGVWQRLALSAAAVGALVAYTGIVMSPDLLRGVFGISTAILSGGMALLIHTGRKKGKRNVEAILKAAGQM